MLLTWARLAGAAMSGQRVVRSARVWWSTWGWSITSELGPPESGGSLSRMARAVGSVCTTVVVAAAIRTRAAAPVAVQTWSRARSTVRCRYSTSWSASWMDHMSWARISPACCGVRRTASRMTWAAPAPGAVAVTLAVSACHPP